MVALVLLSRRREFRVVQLVIWVIVLSILALKRWTKGKGGVSKMNGFVRALSAV